MNILKFTSGKNENFFRKKWRRLRKFDGACTLPIKAHAPSPQRASAPRCVKSFTQRNPEGFHRGARSISAAILRKIIYAARTSLRKRAFRTY
jgi:hypothetical protein